MLPAFIGNIQERIRAEQIRTVKYKFTKATEQMNSHGLIGPYESTDKFVDELQKHFKIIKRCDANHIRDCWPYDTVDLGDGETWDISKTQKGRHLKMQINETQDYSSDNVAIITGDGTPMILNYNKLCPSLDLNTQYGWTTEDNKPVSNATASCVAAVFEINGKSNPNKLNKDVNLLNANGLGQGCALKVDGNCYSEPFAPIPLTYAECMEQKEELGINYCERMAGDKDYWAGAVKACGGKENLPQGEAASQKISKVLNNGIGIWCNNEAPDVGYPSFRNYACYAKAYKSGITTGYTPRNSNDKNAVCLIKE